MAQHFEGSYVPSVRPESPGDTATREAVRSSEDAIKKVYELEAALSVPGAGLQLGNGHQPRAAYEAGPGILALHGPT